ncbi:Guanine nucleotide-binding protein subunit gamma, partial [Penicillium subrubescens]
PRIIHHVPSFDPAAHFLSFFCSLFRRVDSLQRSARELPSPPEPSSLLESYPPGHFPPVVHTNSPLPGHPPFSRSRASIHAHSPTYLDSPTVTMPAYELRSGGDVKNKKQSVADLKYRRLTELNARLKEDLDRPRVKVSEAALSLINYCNNTRDFMVPSVWGQVDKREDPYAPQQQGGCCTVM